MAKDDKAARESKANAEWDEVEATSYGIKALVADVSLATNKQKAQANKASKKAKKRALVLARKEAQLEIKSAKLSEQDTAQREKIVEDNERQLEKQAVALNQQAVAHAEAFTLKLEVESRLKELRNRITESFAAPSLVNKKLTQELELEAKSLGTLVSKLSSEDQSEPLKLLANVFADIGELTALYKSKDKRKDKTTPDIEDVTLKPTKPVSKWKKLANFFDKSRDADGVVSLRKSASTALSMVGGGAKNKLVEGKDWLGGKGLAAYTKSVNTLVDMAGNNPVAVKAIQSLDKGTRTTGSAIKSLGTESFKWLGKKLGTLTGSLMRFIKAPFRSVGGLGNLLGLAALGTMVIGPMLKGVHDELTKQFGDNYVEDFIKGLWSKAWTSLVDMVKEFLGLKTEKTKTEAEKRSETANKSLQEAYKNPNTSSEKELDVRLEAYNAQRAKADEAKGPLGKQRANSKAMEFKTRLQNFVNEEAADGSISKEKAAQLEKEGIKVPSVKISSTSKVSVGGNTQTTNVATAAKAEGNAPPVPSQNATPAKSEAGQTPAAQSAIPAMASAKPTPVSSGGGGGTVQTATPTAAPMDGAAAGSAGPVTAKPASNSAESTMAPTPGGSGKSSATLGVKSVPTYMGGDGFLALSMGVLA